MKKIKVTVWNEFRHEKNDKAVKHLYPEGIHNTIADALNKHTDIEADTATLDQPEHGLGKKVLNKTDVLIWWGHCAHDEVADSIVENVYEKVLEGMGLIVLHSAHLAKVFQKLMGTSCSLKWRQAGEKERLWNITPYHQISEGIGDYIELAQTEMYGEVFDVPRPDEIIFVSWFPGGEVFRSGCTWQRGNGKVFYFRPGHETFPIYKNEQILKVITNAVRWAKPVTKKNTSICEQAKPLEIF